MKKEVKEQNKFNGYLTVFGGIIIHLFLGCWMLWGNIYNYVISHLHYMGD